MADYEIPTAVVEAADADMAGIVKDNLEEFTADNQTKRLKIEAKYLDDWAGPVIMGSFMPAIFALFVVFTGQIIINTNTGLCNFNFNEFIGAAVAVGYLYLVVFSWIFLGDEIRLPIVNWPILMPFTSLKWVVTFFTIIGIASFIINCVGTYEIIFGIFCADSAPVLFNYSCFIVAFYWIGFFVVAFTYIKMTLGREIRGTLEAVQQDLGVGPNKLTPQEEVFKAKFDEFDVNKTNTIPKSSLRQLTAGLDIPMYVHSTPSQYFPTISQFSLSPPPPPYLFTYIPRTLKKRSELAVRLDPEDTGVLEYNALFEWYKQAVLEMDATLGDDDEEEEEGGGDGAK